MDVAIRAPEWKEPSSNNKVRYNWEGSFKDFPSTYNSSPGLRRQIQSAYIEQNWGHIQNKTCRSIAAGPIHTVFPTTEDFIPTGYIFCIYRYIYRYILWRMLWFLAVVSVSHTYFLPPVLGPRCGACVVVELRCREAKSTAREGKRVLSPAWKLLNTCNNAQCMEQRFLNATKL